jgi:hypothetical protein
MPTELRDCAEDSKTSNGQVTYMLSGQMEKEDMPELEALIRSEAKGLVRRNNSDQTKD